MQRLLEPQSLRSKNTPDDSTYFRKVLGHYPTGVCIVTSMDETNEPLGIVVGSFTSVSLSPPLVGFFPARSSGTWPRIAAAKSFCVNVLAADQQEVCRQMAPRGADRFANLKWRASSASGMPIIEGVVAWIDCDLISVSEAGDHDFALGQVRDLGVETGKAPLAFCAGTYGEFMAA